MHEEEIMNLEGVREESPRRGGEYKITKKEKGQSRDHQ